MVVKVIVIIIFNIKWFVLNVFLNVRVMVFDCIVLKIKLNDKVIKIVNSLFI